jgi:hypothetical protein
VLAVLPLADSVLEPASGTETEQETETLPLVDAASLPVALADASWLAEVLMESEPDAVRASVPVALAAASWLTDALTETEPLALAASVPLALLAAEPDCEVLPWLLVAAEPDAVRDAEPARETLPLAVVACEPVSETLASSPVPPEVASTETEPDAETAAEPVILREEDFLGFLTTGAPAAQTS